MNDSSFEDNSSAFFLPSLQLNVEEAAQVPVDHPQWDISDEEDEQGDEESDGGISEFTEDEDDGDLAVEEDDLSDDD